MIVIKLWGGIGNQLFQYAFGYVLAKIKKDKLICDISFYDNQPKYVGRRAVISKHEFPNIDINNSFKRTPLISLLENRYINHLLRYSDGIHCTLINHNILLERLYKFYEDIPHKDRMLNYYDGYWQSEKYFEKFRYDIIKLFTPSKTITDMAEAWHRSVYSDCSVAVHIRRGDYVRKGDKNISQDIDYYMKAMDYIRSHYDDPLFCVFSDDINWCKEQLSGYADIVYVENNCENGDLVDMYSMSLCKHGIISISTFSWWGNWLRKDNSNSMVIYPDGEYFNEYFMPDSWYKISSLTLNNIQV